MNFVSVRSSDLLSKYFGQTESSIRLLFKQVRAAAPCVLFLDEFDVLAFKRLATSKYSSSPSFILVFVCEYSYLFSLDIYVSQSSQFVPILLSSFVYVLEAGVMTHQVAVSQDYKQESYQLS